MKTRRKTRSAYSETVLLDIYDAARAGLDDISIALHVGINPESLKRWKEKHPAVLEALQRARKPKETLRDYLYQKLPEDLQDLWDDIAEVETMRNGVARVEALLEDRGNKVRQHLFLHALAVGNYNETKACRKVNINRDTLNRWKNEDPDFTRLVSEMQIAKGDFFEEGLAQKVDEGDVSCILFANRTYNRNRGYTEGREININGHLTVDHQVTYLEPEGMPLELAKALLQHMQKTGAVPPVQPKLVHEIGSEVKMLESAVKLPGRMREVVEWQPRTLDDLLEEEVA